jgi:hypothetical protein
MGNHRLHAVVRVLDQLGQHVGRVAAAVGGEAAQFRDVTALACEFDEQVDSVGAARVGETVQLGGITAFARQLD